MDLTCDDCKHYDKSVDEEPCNSCALAHEIKWEPMVNKDCEVIDEE
jgi:hypothetical protein